MSVYQFLLPYSWREEKEDVMEGRDALCYGRFGQAGNVIWETMRVSEDLHWDWSISHAREVKHFQV